MRAADWWGPGQWFLGFYGVGKGLVPVDDLVPGCGDVLAWAKRNGARDGTPFFISPSGRAEVLINAFWRSPKARNLAASTQRRYAFSLKVWLDFLHAVGVPWDQATEDTLAMFKEWRLSAEDNEEHVAPGSFRLDLAALRKFYLWASTKTEVDNPVRLRVVGETFFGMEITALEASPSGVRRADVKWLTPEAFRLWRNVGLRGFTTEGLPAERWRGRTEDRDVAYAEGLYATGLRMGEWSSVLTVELPEPSHEGILRCQLAKACAKRKSGRRYWIGRRAAQTVRFYMEEGGRPAAVARGQRAGIYDQVADRWVLRAVRPQGVIEVVDDHGAVREVNLDALKPERRMRLFRDGPRGLEPLWLWLNHDGTPRPKQAWHKTFDRANQRVNKALSQAGKPGRLWCRPHMLRHSFALRWFCIVKFVGWQREGRMSDKERREFREEFGSVWFTMATLLGHSNPETSKQVYLEPFQALEVEQMILMMDGDDRAALERLVNVLAAGEPRVLTAEGA
jgi:site-specific recombinase XerD